MAPSREPAYGTEIRQNFTASVSASSLGGGGEKRLKVSARFQGQSISCFATETLVVRLCVYLGSAARLISSHMAVHTWSWGERFCFLSRCVCWSRCSISCLLGGKNVVCDVG